MTANVEKISVALTPELAATVRQAVASGGYASTNEVIHEALRDWQRRRAVDAALTLELRRLWQEGIASGSAEPLEVAAIKREARARLTQEKMPDGTEVVQALHGTRRLSC